MNESYTVSRQLNDSDRGYYLLAFAKTSVGIALWNVQEWCKVTLCLSKSVIDEWDRTALEKNALVPLSEINPHLAMHLFQQLDNPPPDANGRFPKDVHNHAALAIFLSHLNLLGGKRGFLRARINHNTSVKQENTLIVRWAWSQEHWQTFKLRSTQTK